MKTGDLTVTITAEDRVSPVVRRLSRRLWWYRWGPAVIQTLLMIMLMVAFILGRITA